MISQVETMQYLLFMPHPRSYPMPGVQPHWCGKRLADQPMYIRKIR